ncbi:MULTISPECIES: protein-disulfide reductase DsbD domain-containing protein [Enterobacterales]|uniref:protein-disulfide reductase DsbD domain-containing protein n=1 Tax=Enterobacterales TaxID=91347 RepID=UPI0034DD87E5
MTASTIRLRRWLAGLALLLALPATSAVAQDFELPPVDEVFVLSAQATAPDRIEVRWRIADGYYLYRHRTSVKADAAFTGATMALPKGKAYRDEFFGDVETYRKELLGTLTGTPAAGAERDHPDREVPGLRRCRRVLPAADPHPEGRVAGRSGRWRLRL